MDDAHVAEELLQRYFDGELRAAHAVSVARHIERCPACRKREHALGALRGLIGHSAQESARGVDFEAAYRRIERGIAASPRPGLFERLAVFWRDLSEQRPAQAWLPVAAGAAAAAVLGVVLLGDPEPGVELARSPGKAAPAAGTEPRDEAGLGAGEPASSEVVHVDFGSNPGTVYEIALADGVSTPVVWINDDM